jgi:hypothetical protein
MKAKVIEIKNDIIQDILSEIDYEFEKNGGEVPRFITDFLFEIDEIIYKPTLEEVIKEWEDDGFKFNKIICYALINTKNNIEIYFVNGPTGIEYSIEGCLTPKQLIRLAKTFRALGWER